MMVMKFLFHMERVSAVGLKRTLLSIACMDDFEWPYKSMVFWIIEVSLPNA